MHRHRTLLLALAALGTVSACGTVAVARGGAGPPDLLTSRSPRAGVQAAQTYIRTAHYSFTGGGSQSSTATGLAGFPNAYAAVMSSNGRWTASGAVAGNRRIAVEATFSGVGSVDAIEYDCAGFASVDGTLWAQGEIERSLARLLSPSLDDSQVSAAAWQDLEASGSLRHLHAALTPLSLLGGSPASGATPPPGLSLHASTMDLWMRDDGNVDRLALHVELSMDFAKARTREHPDLAGTMRSTLDAGWTLRSSTLSVQAPLATLGGDPVPAAARLAFGPFSVQTDGCPSLTA